MIKITFKGINSHGQAIFQGYSDNGPLTIIREAIDTYYEFDVFKGHGVGERLRNIIFL